MERREFLLAASTAALGGCTARGDDGEAFTPPGIGEGRETATATPRPERVDVGTSVRYDSGLSVSVILTHTTDTIRYVDYDDEAQEVEATHPGGKYAFALAHAHYEGAERTSTTAFTPSTVESPLYDEFAYHLPTTSSPDSDAFATSLRYNAARRLPVGRNDDVFHKNVRPFLANQERIRWFVGADLDAYEGISGWVAFNLADVGTAADPEASPSVAWSRDGDSTYWDISEQRG